MAQYVTLLRHFLHLAVKGEVCDYNFMLFPYTAPSLDDIKTWAVDGLSGLCVALFSIRYPLPIITFSSAYPYRWGGSQTHSLLTDALPLDLLTYMVITTTRRGGRTWGVFFHLAAQYNAE
mgnify:CR=1 FL=1